MSITSIKSIVLLAAAGLLAGCVSSGYGYRDGGYGHGGYYTGQSYRTYGGYSGGVGYSYPGGVYGYGGYRYGSPSGYYGGVYTGTPYRYGYYGGYRYPYYGYSPYPGNRYYRPPVVIRPHPHRDRDRKDTVRERVQERDWRQLETLRNNNTMRVPQPRAITSPAPRGVIQRAPIRSQQRSNATPSPARSTAPRAVQRQRATPSPAVRSPRTGTVRRQIETP